MEIRPALASDAEALTAIYNEGIEDRCATFETEPRSAAQLERVIATRPVLVAEDHGRVLGFAAAHAYRDRACYDGVAEASVYVSRAARGGGAGRRLLAALGPTWESRGGWKLVGRIFADNAASRALCARCGFREVGTYTRHGRLDGVWKDCVVVELLVGAAAARA
jgi:phosphinothricin acetyltransferase